MGSKKLAKPKVKRTVKPVKEAIKKVKSASVKKVRKRPVKNITKRTMRKIRTKAAKPRIRKVYKKLTPKKVNVRKIQKVQKKAVTKKTKVSKIQKKKIPKNVAKPKRKRKKLTQKEKLARKRKLHAQRRKFLEDPEKKQFLLDIVEEEGMSVVDRIIDKDISDVELADSMELKPNIIRKRLYALYEAGVVTYRRHRSKTGWYTYFWKIHPERIDKVLAERAATEIVDLQKVIEHEQNNHYFKCDKGCTRLIFDEATEQGFRCPECTGELKHHDTTKDIKSMQQRIDELNLRIEEASQGE